MTNVNPGPGATGQEGSADLGRADIRPLRPPALPGAPALGGDSLGSHYAEPLWLPGPSGVPRTRNCPSQGRPGDLAAALGEAAWRAGSSAPCRAPPRARIPRARSRSAREHSPGPGRHQKPRREVAGTPLLPETSESLTSPRALLTLQAARSREPGVCLGRGARLRIRSGSSSASAPRGARASPFGSPASLRRGAPLARAARPRPREAPPTGGPAPRALRAPHAPRAFPLPRSRPLQAGKVLLDSDLTKLRQPRKVIIILHPKSV